MIRSPDNQKLKTIRKLAQKRWREKLGLFAAEGEDLVEAAQRAAWEPSFVLRAGVDVEPELLEAVSTLGSGTRVIGVYEQRWSAPGGDLSVWLQGVEDPGNVGAIIRSAHAFADGPVALGPGCADPFSPKAVRASMGSLFARPPARADFEGLSGTRLALDAAAPTTVAGVELVPPVVLCLGAEREGLPERVRERAEARARIELRPDGPESLNVAMAATVALHEVANRTPARGPSPGARA
jgi:RNA methyltransferase, TrmH family